MDPLRMRQGADLSGFVFRALLVFSLVSPVSIAATNAAWAAALFLALLEAIGRRKKGLGLVLRRTDLDSAVGLLVLASAASVWTSLTPWASLKEARSLGLIVVYYLFAWYTEEDKKRRLPTGCLAASASLAAAYGILQSYTGWDFLGHFDPATGKASGFFSLHLTFGEYLLMTACVALGAAIWGKTGASRDWGRASWLGAALLMAFAVIRTGAKGPFVGLVAGIVVLLALKGRRFLLPGAAVLAVLIVFLLAVASGSPLRTAWELFGVNASVAAGPAASNTQRLFMWWAGWRMSAAHLMTGVGLHGVDTAYPAFRHPLAVEPNQWHLHNNFVQIGVETGLLGLAAFLWLFVRAFQSAWTRFRAAPSGSDQGLAAGVLAALTGFLASGLTEYNWADSEVLLCLYMLLGLLNSMPQAAAARTLPASSEAVGPPAKLGSTLTVPFQERILVVFVTAPVLGASLFVGPGPAGGRTRLFEIAAAFVLGTLAFLPGSAWGVRRRRLTGALLAFAGYSLTRLLWAEPLSSAGWILCLSAASAVGIASLPWGLLPPAVQGLYKGRGARVGSLDLAALAAPLVWAAIGLGTHLLLRVAGVEQNFLDPQARRILAACALTFALYGVGRFLVVGDHWGRSILAATAACLLLAALRNLAG